jgi:hypothetical protein
MSNRLRKNCLSEPELVIVQRYLGIIGQLQALVSTRQEALNDILGLALEARGFSPVTHDIDGNGVITEKPGVKTT